MGGPVNVIPVSAGVKEIVNITTHTVNQALQQKQITAEPALKRRSPFAGNDSTFGGRL